MDAAPRRHPWRRWLLPLLGAMAAAIGAAVSIASLTAPRPLWTIDYPGRVIAEMKAGSPILAVSDLADEFLVRRIDPRDGSLTTLGKLRRDNGIKGILQFLPEERDCVYVQGESDVSARTASIVHVPSGETRPTVPDPTSGLNYGNLLLHALAEPGRNVHLHATRIDGTMVFARAHTSIPDWIPDWAKRLLVRNRLWRWRYWSRFTTMHPITGAERLAAVGLNAFQTTITDDLLLVGVSEEGDGFQHMKLAAYPLPGVMMWHPAATAALSGAAALVGFVIARRLLRPHVAAAR